MEELLEELRYELRRAKMFRGTFADIKRYSESNEWFSASLINQVDAGKNMSDTKENKENLEKLITYIQKEVDLKIRMFNVISE